MLNPFKSIADSFRSMADDFDKRFKEFDDLEKELDSTEAKDGEEVKITKETKPDGTVTVTKTIKRTVIKKSGQ